ncbi:MAG: homoserine dehydrogenase [Verrucomicrobia bacterium]|nr:homoserine dehydrogenase [Verrucomicrobiota bacterium]MDA1087916.1 homoserine dehydrogenase [Verrucomicrobiota bacterium]
MKLRLAFIGFGVVGRGLAEIVVKEREWIKQSQGVDLVAVAVSDLRRGAIYDPAGIDLAACLAAAENNETFDNIDAVERGWDAMKTIRETNADAVIEVTPTDIQTGEPAVSHAKAAFAVGKHVVTTNKGPVVLALQELSELAAANDVQFRYEGTVMSGTPVLNLGSRFLAGNRITRIRGILNGTTNFILSEMEGGMSYEDALTRAQELGYAETKPDADVEGHDALGKVVILAHVLMDARLNVDDIPCTGITGITAADIEDARANGERWRLIGEIRRDGDSVSGSVAPVKVPFDNPLASVTGATNAITFTTELLGDVTVEGPGAGKKETGFALLADLLEIARR